MASTQNIFERRLAGSVHRVYWSPADIQRIAERVGLEPARRSTAAVRRPAVLGIAQRAADAAPTGASYRFTISTPMVDRYDDTIAIGGWHLANYRANPVVLWAHDGDLLPIGRATATWGEGSRLKSSMTFAADGDARRVEGMVQEGTLRAASVGFIPLQWEFSEDPNRPLGIDFIEQELLEWSICGVPANPQCLLERVEPAKGAFISERERRRAARQRDLDAILLRSGRK